MKSMKNKPIPLSAFGNGTLHSGDRMTQPEFHRLYEQMPENAKFELIGGIVYMASPARHWHGQYHVEFSVALGMYRASTPGIEVADNITTILGDRSEPQPDLLIFISPEYGGQVRYDDDDYLVGPPEMVIEIAHSSRAIDLHVKKEDYQREGVHEYVVFSIPERQLHWFHFASRKQLRADRHGIWRSREFPGLWIDGHALVERKTARLIEVVQQGAASPEHARFVKKLERARKK